MAPGVEEGISTAMNVYRRVPPSKPLPARLPVSDWPALCPLIAVSLLRCAIAFATGEKWGTEPTLAALALGACAYALASEGFRPKIRTS